MEELKEALEQFDVAFENWNESFKKVIKVIDESIERMEANLPKKQPIYVDSTKERYGIDR